MQLSGLEVGQLNYVPDLTVDFVLKQTLHGRNVSPGDSVQKGMVIDLVLGRGLSESAHPPAAVDRDRPWSRPR
ncbi:MAG: hypothetical protein U5L72_14095 [Bacteroidales bacterium]|nr:hypothetical protein [Bacteroidales bacterium]